MDKRTTKDQILEAAEAIMLERSVHSVGLNQILKAGKFPYLALNLASEVSDLCEPMRVELAKDFEDWIHIFECLLDEAVEKKITPRRARHFLLRKIDSGFIVRCNSTFRNLSQHRASARGALSTSKI